MRPSKEYLDMISKRLETMNPGLSNGSVRGDSCNEPFKMPDVMGQLGSTAMAYLEKKKGEVQTPSDPMFTDRNTY
jgi:hypothetical protein